MTPEAALTMEATSFTYRAADLASALRQVGLSRGDIVFFHVCLDALGAGADWTPGAKGHAQLLRLLREAIGEEGTLIVPTYTFSYCRGELFDPAATPTRGGPWSTSSDFLEFVRAQPDATRSADPIHSVAAIGPDAAELLADLPPTCFGEGSLFARLYERGARICLLGAPLEEATFRHHSEEIAGAPFRYRKLFTGRSRQNGTVSKTGWVYSVRILAEGGHPTGAALETIARSEGVCRAAPLGQGEVLAVDCRDYHALTLRALAREPWLTARGPAADPVVLEAARVRGGVPPVALRTDATMAEMIDALWRLPRDIISDGYDAALRALADQVPMRVHQFPSGLQAWTWIVPEKWTCHEAFLETLDGRRLLSYADNPLHVVSYSLPRDGVVTRTELLEHLHVHPRLPDAVPFVFKYYERDWGLCATQRLRDTLVDEQYRVLIRTSFSFGTLKVGEVVVPGRTDDTIVLCAHLCHPAMVNDDLSGVVVGIDVMRRLLAGPTPRYTYRLLIVPETIGSVAFLSQNQDLIRRMRGGLFLEMLGRSHPHALQLSFTGTAEIDRCCTLALREHDPGGWATPFRSLMGNDERQFNAPGVRVPMLSLTRQLPVNAPDHPYREYHSSADTPQLVPPGALEESRDLVLRTIDILERNARVSNRFSGEVFCSRFGIHFDPSTEPEANKALFDIMFLIDGTCTLVQMAERTGVPFSVVDRVVGALAGNGLVELAPADADALGCP